MTVKIEHHLCPCSSGQPYQICCEPLHLGDQNALSAEALMRSRYAAFATKNVDYLVATMDPASRARFSPEEARRWMDTADFVGLEILEATEDSKTALVEFKAWFIDKALPQTRQVHHERSLFRKKDGAWLYIEAKTPHHS
ncbi:MAG: YchJ family protein [Bdellovibrio sp.]